VSAAKPAAEGTPAASPKPTSVRVAVGVMALLGVLMLINATLLGLGFSTAVDRLVEAGGDVSRDAASSFVLTSLLSNLLLGLLLVVSAIFLPRRQPWARWTGLIGVSVLGLLTLFQVLAAGAVSVVSLLVVVLSAAGVASLVARTTTAWVPSMRGRG
jgi:hypothetical protein